MVTCHKKRKFLAIGFLSLILILNTWGLSFDGSNLAQASFRGEPSIEYSTAEPRAERIDVQFELISPATGWILEGDRLYLTFNNGVSWNEITPLISPGQKIEAVTFLDGLRGWVVISQAVDNLLRYEITATKDGGGTWDTLPFASLSPQDMINLAQQVHMQWIDDQAGWILFKLQTGNNFSRGLMFLTADGGQSWEKLDAPMGEPFTFINERVGFMAGGPNGASFYRSADSGRTWQEISSSIHASTDVSPIRFSLPTFTAAGYGLLALQHGGADKRVTLFETFDWGVNWAARDSINLDQEIDDQLSPYLIMTEANHYRLWMPNSMQIIGVDNGESVQISFAYNAHHLSQLRMRNVLSGWGEFVESTCAPDETVGEISTLRCLSSIKYAFTENGGVSWAPLILPSGKSDYISEVQSENELITDAEINAQTANTQIFIGQGFDKCEIPSLSQMQTWYTSSPYKTVNLYIGGVSRACSNAALTADYISQLYQQGWKFFPTWVGPQAPCSGYYHKISYDPAVAYQQGLDNATQAVAVLSNLGLTLNDGTGSVVYYDIEAYTGDSTCYAAVNAFMNGWSARLKELGNLSGIYGSSCASHLTNYFSLPNPPDVIWPAAWYHSGGLGYYSPTASVWGVSCISDSVYANHQRIRQYEGGHLETWGGVTLNIDCDVLDGVVAIPNNPDSIPPVSSISLSGTAGENGWFRSSVTATLSATDDLTGVSYTQYNLDSVGWITYTGPITISNDGSHLLQYRSVDNAGNWEGTKSAAVKIDTVSPLGLIQIMDGWETTCQTAVRMETSAGDNTSGVALLQLRDAGGIWTGWLPYSSTSPWLLPALTGQTYTVEVQYKDRAGNISAIYSDSIHLDIYPDHPASQNFQLSKSTFGMSGTDAQSANFQLNGTLSQVSASGYSESDHYQVLSGFWNWLSSLVEFFSTFLPLITK